MSGWFSENVSCLLCRMDPHHGLALAVRFVPAAQYLIHLKDFFIIKMILSRVAQQQSPLS